MSDDNNKKNNNQPALVQLTDGEFNSRFPFQTIPNAASEEIKYAAPESAIMGYGVADCILVFVYTPNKKNPTWAAVFHGHPEGASADIDSFEASEETITDFLSDVSRRYFIWR